MNGRDAMARAHILVVDDEEEIRQLVTCALSAANYAVSSAGTAHEALDVLSECEAAGRAVDLLLTDFNLPDRSGLSLVEDLGWRGKELPVIVMSGSFDEDLGTLVMERHCDSCLTKPFRLDFLIHEVERCLNNPARTKTITERQGR